MQKVFAIPILSDVALEAHLDVQQTEAPENAQNSDHEMPVVMDYYETPISIESIGLVAFSLLGLWAAVTSVPTSVKEINSALVSTIYDYSISSVIIRWSILPHLIEFGIGIWLFLRPWQFQGWIEKFKRKDDSSEETTPTGLKAQPVCRKLSINFGEVKWRIWLFFPHFLLYPKLRRVLRE